MNPHRKLPSHWIIPFMGLSISIFIILIWLIGPVQNQAKQEEYILRSVNFYQDTFVWEINDLNQDLLIDLNTRAIVLKVRH